MQNDLFAFDNKNILDGRFLIGTDEAGRGPGAGPVAAAAVCFTNTEDILIKKLSQLNDSKQLTEKNGTNYIQSLLKTLYMKLFSEQLMR